MKHSPISLLERAAEAFDLHKVLQPAPEAAAAVEPVAREAPPSPVETAPPAAETPSPQPKPAPQPSAPRRRPAGAERAIERERLEQLGYVVPDAPVTGLAEEFRLVKRQLLAEMARQQGLADAKRRTILICSGSPREGKSFCSINLALSLAGEKDFEVLLVDGDFVKPDIFQRLGVEAGPGLVDALADPGLDPESLVVRTDVPGLSLLSAGRKVNDIPELLASGRSRDLLGRLAAADPRRIILFDSPPALMASCARILADQVGQALVVVRADLTTESDLRETVELLGSCEHVGLILNGAAMTASGRKYGAYKGYPHAD